LTKQRQIYHALHLMQELLGLAINFMSGEFIHNHFNS